MASDRRLRSSSSQRIGAPEPGRRAKSSRRGATPVGDGGVARVSQRRPRPDGLPGSVRATAARDQTLSTRRVAPRVADGRSTSGTWRPYAPSAVTATQDWWGPEQLVDARPLVTELSSKELAEEALSALRVDRPVAPDEPWLLDMGAHTPAIKTVPRHASTRVAVSQRPVAAPRPTPAPPRHRRPDARPRRTVVRAAWIALVGVAVAVAVGFGWTVTQGADDTGPGSVSEAPVTQEQGAPNGLTQTSTPNPASPAAVSLSAEPVAAASAGPTAAPSVVDQSTGSNTTTPTASTASASPVAVAPPAVVITLG